MTVGIPLRLRHCPRVRPLRPAPIITIGHEGPKVMLVYLRMALLALSIQLGDLYLRVKSSVDLEGQTGCIYKNLCMKTYHRALVKSRSAISRPQGLLKILPIPSICSKSSICRTFAECQELLTNTSRPCLARRLDLRHIEAVR